MNKFPQVILKVIPHNKQRYDSVGDYFKKGNKWFILCSKMKAEFVFLVLIHEFVEWFLCQMRGIKNEDIDKFDMEFEKNRKQGNEDEPGDDPRAPYFCEHQFASQIEKTCAEELGVDWNEYEDILMKL